MSKVDSTPFPKFGSVTTTGRRFKNFTGQRFRRLLVVGLAGRYKGRTQWYCLCDCGQFLWATGKNLQAENTKSCGCLQRQVVFDRSFQHGRIRTPEWYSWVNMQDRCFRKKLRAYARYGGRGITVSKEWLGRGGFQRFLNHIGLRPSPTHSIDRIDNDGNYEPGNVRWATKKEQSRNRSTTHFITFQGDTLTMSEWAARCGISDAALRYRLEVHPLEIALTSPKCNKHGHGNRRLVPR